MPSFDHARPDFAAYGLSCVKWTPSAMRRPDRHNEVELNLLPAGSLTYLLGGRRATVPAMRLWLFWAAIPHQVVGFDRCRSYHVATLPLAWFLQAGLPAPLVQPILHGETIADPAPRGEADLSLMRQWTIDLSPPGSAEARRVALLEIEARLRRLAMHLPAYAPPKRPARRRRRRSGGDLARSADLLAAFVARHYTEPIDIADIAAAADLNPNYAMTLFKSTFGTTLSRYLNEHRLWHAQRLLATTDRPILEIALDAGFGSVSRFNDVFRRGCGRRPREFRRAHQPADA